jgi:hypothetical protein
MAKRRSSPVRTINARCASLSAQFVSHFCELSGTEFGRKVATLLSNREWDQLVELTVDPGDYVNPWDYRVDYCIASLLSKADFLPLAVDREAVAISKFIEAEEICRVTNQRLKTVLRTPSVGITMASYIHTAAHKIASVLGPFDWNEAEAGFSWGPGASTRLSRVKASPVYKYSGKPEVTPKAALLAYTAINRIPLWRSDITNQSEVQLEDILTLQMHNKVITVPKNAKTDRVIAIEPCMNMYIQKGLGSMIRRRLRKVGIDLNDQGKNQELAKLASLGNTLATIDLSAASDTISYELVRQLLPADWFDALEAVRSESGALPSGDKIRYQKFSSMGNGYTFELESLIFWALCQAVLELAEEKGIVSVYGDDIVFPSAHVPKLKEVFTFCGFTLNEKKTYTSGPFRESCGKHYFRGMDVTPFYIREDVTSIPRTFWLANSLVRWLDRIDGTLDRKYYDLWLWLYSSVPEKFRYPIPEGIGDGGFVMPFDMATPSRAPRGFCGWIVNFVSVIVQTNEADETPAVIASLHELDRGKPNKLSGLVPWPPVTYVTAEFVLRHYAREVAKEELRDRELSISYPSPARRVRPCKTVVLQWAELGPWV